jgi:hypothetical protein
MYADPNNPSIKRFREIRDREKELAVLRKQIRETNPTCSDRQLHQIALAAYRAKNAERTIKVLRQRKQRHTKKRSRHWNNSFDVRVQVVNSQKTI